jgi:hypothetical protein
MIRNVSIPYNEVEESEDGNINMFEVVNVEDELNLMVLLSTILKGLKKKTTKEFLRVDLTFPHELLP